MKRVSAKQSIPVSRRTKAERKTSTNADGEQPFPIVGIGASAGGLEAFIELLAHLPISIGNGVCSGATSRPKARKHSPANPRQNDGVPVLEAKNNLRVEPNRIYVIPPNATMTIADGVLKLGPRSKARGALRSIDFFLHSLAKDQGSKAIGVILSGTDYDGSSGIEAVKGEGGITFAQDEQSAKFDSMPRHAVMTGSVDKVLTPKQIAEELGRIASARAFLEPSTDGEQSLEKILNVVRALKKVDFRLYKSTTIKRRIERRMTLAKISKPGAYATYLREHPAEVDALYQDILINVTQFFRDPEVFEVLKQKVFPKIIGKRSPNDPVRIWVTGCSMGQEAYSIAMAFLEFASSAATQIPLQIFATDLNEAMLEKARLGRYTRSQVQEVSPERLHRFFVEEDGTYNISKSIRDMCIFARHDIVNDPAFSRMDFVSCRNMLIYFETSLQKKVIPAFHYALKPGGFLLLGSSETVGEFSQYFSPENKACKIYTKTTSLTAPQLELPGARPIFLGPSPPPEKVSFTVSLEAEAQKESDRIVLSKYAPAGVIVNANMDVLQFRGSTSPYLEISPGKAHFHLLKMAREGLLMPLRTALHKAKKENRAVRQGGISIESDGNIHKVNIEVVPLNNLKERCFLVLFEPASAQGPEYRRLANEARIRQRLGKKEDAAAEVSRLQNELAAVREYFQTTTEQHDAIAEELQASNEEAHSANEELQSINEELETTKEELESTNEELRTVNDEMSNRNTDLYRMNSDLNNVLNGVQMCIVVLGKDLCIRRFTPLAEKVLNLVPSDAGRPITNIKPNIEFPDLEQFIGKAIDDVRVQNAEVQDKEGKWYSIRAVPYKTLDNKIDGAVLVLVDIDAVKRSEGRIQAALNYAEGIIETVREPLLVLSTNLHVESANRSFYEKFRVSPKETVGRLFYDLGNGAWNIPKLRTLLQEIIPRKSSFDDFEVEHDFERVGHRVLLLNARRIAENGLQPERILLAIEDISDRKNVELLRDSEQRYRTLAETLPQLVWTCPPDGKCDYFNSKWTEYTGLPLEKLLGDKWRKTMHPVDREQTCDYWIDALKDVVPYDLEYRLKRADGEYHWFKTRAVPLRDKQGKIVKWFGTCTDIEDQKQAQQLIEQSENWLRLIVESVKDFAIFTLDVKGRVNSWNPGAQAVFGFTDKEIMGQSAAILFTPEDRAHHAHEKELSTAQKNGAALDERWHLRKDGSRFFASGVMRVIRDDDGKLRGFTKVARDVTEKKTREEQLQRAHDELEMKVSERTARLQDIVQELEAFSYSVSHDMRAPLRAMISYAQMILEDFGASLPDDGRNYLNKIITSAQRLDRLVTDVLIYSRASRGDMELHPIDLEKVIHQAIEDNPQFQPPNAEIKIQSPLPEVIGHEASLMQCVNNFLTNAVKFRLPETLPKMKVWSETKGDDVRVWFEDNGIGIAPSDVTRIFSLFGRLHPTSKFEGSGIGLTIARKAVQRMGGRIGVESTPGKGSRFWIEMKHAGAERHESETKAKNPHPVSGG